MHKISRETDKFPGKPYIYREMSPGKEGIPRKTVYLPRNVPGIERNTLGHRILTGPYSRERLEYPGKTIIGPEMFPVNGKYSGWRVRELIYTPTKAIRWRRGETFNKTPRTRYFPGNLKLREGRQDIGPGNQNSGNTRFFRGTIRRTDNLEKRKDPKYAPKRIKAP